MNVISSTAATELIMLGLAPGETLLESIRNLVAKPSAARHET